MSIIIPANSAAGGGGFAIDNSCRFNIASSDDLRRTFSSGDRKTWTWSSWIKRATLGANQSLFSCHTGDSDTAQLDLKFDSGDTISYEGKNTVFKTTSRVFRDTSAFYHIMFVLDMTQATASNRMKFYVNGVLETSFATDNTPARNTDLGINQNSQHVIGMKDRNTDSFGGYLAETVFINAAALAPTDFGEFDEDSGIWKPIDVSGLTPSTNGFYLDYKDSSSLGNDVYGSNNFTVNNLTSIDQTTDTCTNNFCTMNPLDTHSSATLSEGNTGIATTASGWFGGSGTMGITLGQPAYFEAKAISSARLYFGLSRIGQGVRGTTLNNGAEGDSNFDYMWRTTTANTVYYGGSNQSITIGAISANDICACSVASDGEVKFYLNDSTVVTFSTKLVADYFYFPILSANAFGGGTESWLANFGNPAYAISSGNQDANGYGNFEFATKGGYALNTKKPSGVWIMAYTDIDNPELYFQTKLYSGNGSTNAITLDGSENMQPNFVWIKNRPLSGGYAHNLFDSVRGTNKKIVSNDDRAETTETNTLNSFNSNGFTLGNDSGTDEVNKSGTTFVSWNWKAGTSVSGTTTGAGTNKSYTGSVNTTSGISIIRYQGNGTNGHTIPHHLGVTPTVMMVKRLTTSSNWSNYQSDFWVSGGNQYIDLNRSAAAAADSVMWYNTQPTSSVFTVGTNERTNYNNDYFINYLFTPIQGYSKFSSYVGNGNADGTFVYTGFKPAFVMVKRTDGADQWSMSDNKRNGFNPQTPPLYADSSEAENASFYPFDFLSNGFKARSSSSSINTSGGTYIYMAFAENPFVTSTDNGSIPACAR